MQNFLNTLGEFSREKEDKDNFIQKALKVCKAFKVKPLKAPRPDVPSKKTAYNLFCKDIRKTKKELKGVSVSKESAVCRRTGEKLRPATRRCKSRKNFTKKRNDDMKRPCRGTKKII